MKKRLIIKISSLFAFALLVLFACKEEEYTMGTLSAPSNLVINTQIVGQNTANPNGDGSGLVKITASAENALSYKISYLDISDMSAKPDFEAMKNGTAEKKFTNLGTNTYRITVVAYGPGGTSTTATKDIVVKSVYNPPAAIVTNLTNNSSKTWKVDASVAGHFGVGPWSPSSVTPEWWSAAVNEKAVCCNCFYTATFTFTQVSSTSFTITSNTPDGIYAKTGALAGVAGLPATGPEQCYPYAGGTSAFSFIGASSGVAPTAPSTQTSIVLDGNSTFIAYGSLKKEYEILEITPNYMYLRVQGTETGNAWYIKLIPVQ